MRNPKTTILLASIFSVVAVTAYAADQDGTTFGTDQYGNRTTSTKIGNDTFTSGTNPTTGQPSSQTDIQIGNTTFTSGMANGRSYSGTQTTIPSTPPETASKVGDGSCLGINCGH